MREVRSYCRICSGNCGVIATIGEEGRVQRVRGDHEHAMTQGYVCIKGVESPAMHNGAQRLLHPLKRQSDGSFTRIPLEQALDEIAARLKDIIERDGPRAVALFRGTPNYANAAASYMNRFFLKAIGSPNFYSTMTIDQSAKWVTEERLGSWAAGRHRIDTADVFLCFGYNPLVSVQGGYGFYVNNPTKRMHELKARGLKLIVVDPRRTETARFADIHLQPLPGEDAVITAGMLRMILEEGWYDVEFCRRWVKGLDELRALVAPFTPRVVAQRASIPEDALREAVRLFAHDSRRGIAMTGTGPDMAPHANLANHLIECLNVVCGRFNREGERVANTGVLERRRVARAEARSPRRQFESGPRSRVRGLGRLMGEMMTCTLPEDILTPGEGQIRAMFNVAGNPASVFPDQRKSVAALNALELLVSFDTVMSNTARLSHYILPPKLMFERPDGPQIWETVLYPVPFAQYTPAIADPPAGSEVVDEWYPLWGIAQRLGLQIVFCGRPLDMGTSPTSDELLDLITQNAQLPLAEVRKHPGGVIYETQAEHVQPARPDCTGAFEVAASDVQMELRELAHVHENAPTQFTHRLAVRRTREVMNSSFREVPGIRQRAAYNPLAVNPDDMRRLRLSDGD
ncbi:MAG: molybdopterin-dependent oxidoreductase, partial [Steroidobacteraceae bacterium]